MGGYAEASGDDAGRGDAAMRGDDGGRASTSRTSPSREMMISTTTSTPWRKGRGLSRRGGADNQTYQSVDYLSQSIGSGLYRGSGLGVGGIGGGYFRAGGAGGETASRTTAFAWRAPFLEDFSRRHSSPALPFQRLTGKTFD